MHSLTCPECGGEGYSRNCYLCPECDGTGRVAALPFPLMCLLFLVGAYGIHYVLLLILTAMHAGPWALGVSIITGCMLSAYCILK